MDLLHAGLLVNAQLAARLPIEMLDGIGYVDLLPIDLHLFQALIQQFPRWTNEGTACSVLVIPWLLADHHDGDFRSFRFCSGLQFAEDRLGSIAIQIASTALLYRRAQDRQCALLRHKWFRALLQLLFARAHTSWDAQIALAYINLVELACYWEDWSVYSSCQAIWMASSFDSFDLLLSSVNPGSSVT